MNNPEATATIATAGVASLINFIIGEIFDIPPATVFVAFMGCFMGLMARPGIEMPESTKETLKLVGKNCAMLIFITMMTSWAIPLVAYLLPDIAQKTIAAILGFVLMFMYSKQNLEAVINFLSNWFRGKFKS